MADTKVSALAAVSAALATHEFPVNESGASKKATLAQVRTLVNTAPVFDAGSATASSKPKLTSGTLLTAAEAGALELDATNLYSATEASNRGIVPLEYFIRANATRTFTSNTLQQAIFASPANGALTLPVGVYEFECFLQQTSMSATIGNGAWSLIGAGTATLTQVLQLTIGQDASTEGTGTISGLYTNNATSSAANSVTAAGIGSMGMFVRGTFNVSVAGTIIPSFAQTTAAAAVVSIGSYFKCKRLGAQAVTSVGNWS